MGERTKNADSHGNWNADQAITREPKETHADGAAA